MSWRRLPRGTLNRSGSEANAVTAVCGIAMLWVERLIAGARLLFTARFGKGTDAAHADAVLRRNAPGRKVQVLVSLLASPVVPAFLLVVLLSARARQRLAGGGKWILSLSQVMWDDVWQRPQEYAWRASTKDVVIYCAPVQIHRWIFSLRGRWKPVQLHEQGRRLVVLSPLILSGHYKSALIRSINCWMVAWVLQAWLRDADEVCCVTNTPFMWPEARALFGTGRQRSQRLRCLAYDVIDDFPAFEWAPKSGRSLEADLLDNCDTVFTGTYQLMEMHRHRFRDVQFIPCGVDFDLFNRRAGAMPVELQGLPRPIVGYTGSISERIDCGLIASLAASLPKGCIVMIGPDTLTEADRPTASRIHYLGLRRHEELPAFVQHFDVALIPFRITEATLRLNPVKTLEYLAAGVPVVSTALPDVEKFFAEAVLIAGSSQDFIRLVREAAESPDPVRRERGVEMARSASWDEMVVKMNRRILGGSS